MGLSAAVAPRGAIDWNPAFRAIPSRFPPIGLFERVADPGDLEDVFAVESLTNARLRDEVGEITLVPEEERISGPGTGHVMAAFTHVRPEGGRFHDGTFGAFYAAAERATAIAETVYHRERFLRNMQAPPTEVDMRMLRARIRGEMIDLRGLRGDHPDLYHLTDYAAGQAFSRDARSLGAPGIAYDSVRRDGGSCVAVLRPRSVAACKQAEHLGYVWNGESIGVVYEKRIVRR
jgi:hypothetical protein